MTRFLLPCAVAAVLAACTLLAKPAVAAPGHSGTERAVIRLINQVRGQYGLPRLRAGRRLARAADRHSADMVARHFFAHASSDGTPFAQRVRRYRAAVSVGECLAAVGSLNGGAGRVVQMWMGSPAHRAILLTRAFRRVGIGARRGSLGGRVMTVFTADFSSRR